jgi:primary-amine oxidase
VTQSQNHTASPAPHPLDRLTADEIRHVKRILVREGLVTATTRFPWVALDEPDKRIVLDFRPGDPVRRAVRVLSLDRRTGASTWLTISLTEDSVVATRPIDAAVEGQPPIMLEEFETVEAIVKNDQDWLKAMANRGIDNVDLVCVCPLSAGNLGRGDEAGRRMLRCLSFVRNRPDDAPWAHPVDGLVAFVDLTEGRIIELIDDAILAVPTEEGNYTPDVVGTMRNTLKPIEITQPDGPSFTVEGDLVRWQNWSFRIGYEAREGLVLHQIGYRDGERDRPIVHRASMAEMVVPYGDPSPARYWQNYFDSGEYSLGKQVNSLRLGCDCLGEIHYFDAVLADDHCEPQEFPNAICLHEEDHGVLWKHTDIFTGSDETRRQRRLVVSFFATVGNYDYGFYWYLYLDGTIEFQIKATGVVFTSAYPGEGYRWAAELAPGLGAPHHQHLFCARLDMTVDGVPNAVEEQEAIRIPIGPDNPYGNAIGRRTTRLRSESEAARLADSSVGRSWRVVNPSAKNRLGEPVSYVLTPQGQPPLLADPSSVIARRAAFATKHLWVTEYHEDERFPAGDLINQHPGGAGIPDWQDRDADLDGQDIVLWHVFGMTHFPRPEDWPVMPVDTCGFTLKPAGFFDRNPTLDVPGSSAEQCH